MPCELRSESADFCQGIFGRFCTHSDRVGPFLADSVSMGIVVVSQKKKVLMSDRTLILAVSVCISTSRLQIH